MPVTVGIDPDSHKYGVAVFKEGELTELLHLTLVELVQFIREREVDMYAVEDVKSNAFMYSRNNNGMRAAAMKIAQNVGQCKQAQQHACEFLEDAQKKIIFVKPQKGNWAKSKAIFEKATGWAGRSNEDTRAAAYIGWLAQSRLRSGSRVTTK